MVHKQHESFFSYNVSRPLPFKWFTPIAVIGGAMFIALFTLLNFGSNGYDLILQTTSNPNANVAHGTWFTHWPSYFTSQIRPTCQPIDIPIGSQVFTNQSALLYTLVAAWQEGNGSRTLLPSLTYQNHVLQNCSVNAVEIDMAELDRSPVQLSYNEWNLIVYSFLTCHISTDSGVIYLNLTQTYDYIPTTLPLSNLKSFTGTEFLARDQESQASLWWGESLMSAYWVYTSWLLQQARQNKTDNGQSAFRKGVMYFYRSDEAAEDITSLDYLNVDYRFFTDTGGGLFDVTWPGTDGAQGLIGVNDQQQRYPNIWVAADGLAKSAYSTVLADLGQVSQHNILTDPTTLQYFASNLSLINSKYIINAYPGPATEGYDTLEAKTGPLRITPSVIAARYFCQVPKLKSASNLIIAILVADLVLVRAVWQIYNWITQAYLTKIKPDSEYCRGCLMLMDAGLGSHAIPTASTASGYQKLNTSNVIEEETHGKG